MLCGFARAQAREASEEMADAAREVKSTEHHAGNPASWLKEKARTAYAAARVAALPRSSSRSALRALGRVSSSDDRCLRTQTFPCVCLLVAWFLAGFPGEGRDHWEAPRRPVEGSMHAGVRLG